jgi:hypothetical protein
MQAPGLSRLRPRASWTRRGALVALAAVALVGAACAPQATAAFDPSTQCNPSVREQMSGAYPDLEARIPTEVGGKTAASRDSGRFCSADKLGSIYEAGVSEVRFGGAIWKVGRGGVQVGAFEGDGLTAELMAEEYRRAADKDRGTEAVRPTTLEIAGRPAWRIDVINGSSRQAIVVWPSADGRVVQTVVAADVDESVLQEAIGAFR